MKVSITGHSFRLGSKVFPTDTIGILKNKSMTNYYQDFVRSELSSENANFLLAMIAKKAPKFMVDRFIAIDSAEPINISGVLRKEAVAHVREPGSELAKKRSWGDVLGDCQRDVVQVLQFGATLRFWKSDHFENFCFSIIGTPTAAAKTAGVTGAAGIKLFGEVMIASALRDPALMKSTGNALLRHQGIKMPLPDLVKGLRKKGFLAKPAKGAAKVDPSQLKEVRINTKALGLCGFERPLAIKNDVQLMVEAHLKGRSREAKARYADIQKAEASLKHAKLSSTLKLMKKFMVFQM